MKSLEKFVSFLAQKEAIQQRNERTIAIRQARALRQGLRKRRQLSNLKMRWLTYFLCKNGHASSHLLFGVELTNDVQSTRIKLEKSKLLSFSASW